MREQVVAKFRSIYGREPDVVTRAPGRIEFIGNHTDYNGGTVLGAAIDKGIWVAVARRDNALRKFASSQADGVVAISAGEPQRQTGKSSWTNYPLGVVAALPVFGLRAPGAFDFLAVSNLPVGAGLSSSAALELSSALAFLALTEQQPDRETVVKVGKHAENNFVGVPCGILDQGVSGFGKKNSLVFIDCRGPHFSTVPLPPSAHFWIFNTHTKHALVDGLYAERHRECMEAARGLGVSLLVEADAERLESHRQKLSPVVFRRAKHIVEEIQRVQETNTALKKHDLAAVGRLLTASHRSSQRLFENSSAELDFLVDELVKDAHVFGARLTGGGFGGAAMAVTDAEFGRVQAEAVVRRYAEKFGAAPEILHCQTDDGAEVL